jgi:hypothetical protein
MRVLMLTAVRNTVLSLALAGCAALASCASAVRPIGPGPTLKDAAVLKEIRYKGIYIDEAPFEGQRKADGMAPNYAQGLRLSRNRWMVMYDTVDRRGFDVWTGVFYQVRADFPDGRVLTNGILAAPDPVGGPVNGTRLFMQCGQPALFGVPKGAQIDGKVPEQANLFAATWLKGPVLHYGGLVDRAHTNILSEHGWTQEQIAAVEPLLRGGRQVMHFRLNDAGDDIEILSKPMPIEQEGFPGGRGYGWAQPIRDNADGTRWLEAVQIDGGIAVTAYEFDPKTREFRWTRTGAVTPLPTTNAGEPSLVKLQENDYVILVRGFSADGNSFWYRTPDPFASFGQPAMAPDTVGQRYAWLCPDGVLRLFMNRQRGNPYGDRRNPLYCWDVDPADFSYSDTRIVADVRAKAMDPRMVPLKVPFVDHCHLFDCTGDRQVITFRAIAARQVARTAKSPEMTGEDWKKGGIHHAEIVYEGNPPPRWTF